MKHASLYTFVEIYSNTSSLTNKLTDLKLPELLEDDSSEEVRAKVVHIIEVHYS